jgi:hypothetical protein
LYDEHIYLAIGIGSSPSRSLTLGVKW